MSNARLQEARRRGGRDDYSCSLRGARQRLRPPDRLGRTGRESATGVSGGALVKAQRGGASRGPLLGPILFVGERRSPRAMAMGVTWTHGRLSAKTLHEAL